MSQRRADRVARQIQEELSRLAHRELKDPRVGMVTFTRVDLSADLRDAEVGWTPLGGLGDEERIRSVGAGLNAAAPFLQRKLGRNLQLRFTPRLTFRYDRGVANLVDMHDVFQSIKNQQEGTPSPDEEAE